MRNIFKNLYMKLIYTLPIIIAAGFIVFLLNIQSALSEPQRHRTHHPMYKQTLTGQLPTGYNDLFAGSGECLMCHDEQVNSQGDFIGILSDWRSSMMANSSKDPFWRAKVSHETLVNPEHAALLEDVCTRCHAPLGHFNAHFNGQEYYAIADLEGDPLARDGVSCTLCHQVKPESLGNYSGQMLIGENKTIWGPYENPFPNPMINHTGYTPTHSPHIRDAQLCGSCHTLLTPTIDHSGNLTGTYFPEQAIYHEWLNSEFSENAITCQNCHMPSIDDTVKISSMPPWLDGRSPFAMHHLAGANVFMLKLMKENMAELGITATPEQMDSTINRAKRMLQQNALTVDLTETGRTADTLFLELLLENHAGHKFPTGYPSRRAWVEVIVATNTDTLFHSGKTDGSFNLLGENDDFEPHHDVINENGQVQIYEMVMGDVDLEPTTVLAYAYQHLKDNRIPPHGFSSEHFTWDTVAVAGNAMADPDFNKDNGVEGTGRDRIKYHVPISGFTGALSVTAKVHYQTVSNRWLSQMFEYSSGEIDLFKTMYENADQTPVLVASVDLVSTATALSKQEDRFFTIHPNPGGGQFFIQSEGQLSEVNIYDQNGRLKQTFGNFAPVPANKLFGFTLDEPNGVYLVEVLDDHDHRNLMKIILNR